MDYTPIVPPVQKPIPVTYELKTDVTKKAFPKRGPQVLKDGRGHELKVPNPPKDNCRKCYGRGFLGNIESTGALIVCSKCYPPRNK